MPRIHIEGGVYYVTVRGDHDERIFREAEDYQSYLNLLKKYKEQYGFKLFAFTLLINHLCLLIELREGVVLSDIMHDLNANYTKYFNKKYSLKGHLFQETYKAGLIEKLRYIAYMSAYIHLYPCWLDPGAADPACSYSSYPIYLRYSGTGQVISSINPGFCALGQGMAEEIEEVLSGLNAGNYESYLQSIPENEMKNFARELKRNAILGSEAFKETARLRIKDYQRQKYLQEMSFLKQRINDLELEERAKEWEGELR